MTETSYRIMDESAAPRRWLRPIHPYVPACSSLVFGRLTLLVCVYNAFAIGSRTKWRECGWCIFGFAGYWLLNCALDWLFATTAGAPSDPSDLSNPYFEAVRYLFLLAVNYQVAKLQLPPYELRAATSVTA